MVCFFYFFRKKNEEVYQTKYRLEANVVKISIFKKSVGFGSEVA